MMFECHITCPLDQRDMAASVAKAHHWSTSEIERDPVLGKASYFYLTSHGDDYRKLFDRMEHASYTLRRHNVTVIREKIELIMYDTKGKV